MSSMKNVLIGSLCSSVLLVTACQDKVEGEVNTKKQVTSPEQLQKAEEDFNKCVFENFQTPEKCDEKKAKIDELTKQVNK